MEVQLQDLIDKIKTKGIKQAEAEADKIRSSALAEAKKITNQAKKDAEQLLDKTKQEIASFKQSADQALQQAGRDLILALKAEIQTLFDTVLKAEVKAVLQSKVLEDVLLLVVKEWVKKGISDISLMVSAEDLKKLEKFLLTKCASEMKKGIVIKALPDIKAGFRIMEKDGTAYYNITEEGIAEFLGEYLNPKLADLFKQTSKKGSET
ncbi:MAG: V-type ATP synthase subunit E [Spirochaetales bacterium]|nr:V-type ATP synthase subunit E [Spirochaetales bacterium]